MTVRLWMRSAWAIPAVLAMGACAATLCAQDGSGDPANLTVWVVRPATAADRAVQRAQNELRDSAVYRESTAGSFGKSASDVGQTSGSYGKSASNVGKNASDAGVNAGDYGQTASSLPSTVTSQTAGSYGTTAGSFGTSASDFSGAPTKVNATDTPDFLLKTSAWQSFTEHAREALRSTHITFLEVRGLELRERLKKAEGTYAYPDVLLLPPTDYAELLFGEVPSSDLQALLDRLALIHVGRPFPWTLTRELEPQSPLHREPGPYNTALGMVRAPHPVPTRRFLEWFDGDSWNLPGSRSIDPDSPEAPVVKIALEVTASLFAGGTAEGWADDQMAKFTLANATSVLYVPRVRVPADLHVESVVLQAKANSRFAAVLLQSEVVSGHAYGHFAPLVILRRNAGGQWKVLHVSLDLGPKAADAYKTLAVCAEPAGPKGPGIVKPVALASPADGENRPWHSGLELWWDDDSNARVLVVEYQSLTHDGPDAPHIFLVDDRQPLLQTRVGVPFGDSTGSVRWRVWSLGEGGSLRLTDWRTVNLVR